MQSSEWISLIWTLGFSLIALYLAKKYGYFKLSVSQDVTKIPITVPIFGFLIYLGGAIILSPLINFFIENLFLKGSANQWDAAQKLGTFQFVFGAILFLLIIGYCFILPFQQREQIFWGRKENKTFLGFSKDFLMGMLSLAICYPIMAVINILAGWVSTIIWREKGIEQVAVKNLHELVPYPFSFVLMAIVTIFFIPIIEEILFRGFLQSWIKRHLGRWSAILIVAFFFSLVHYSSAQGRGNFELIVTLFVLSFFLGFIYERQSALWAPIGMHMTFNAITSIAILFA